ncbi:hypothetical protein OPKNFCMD_6605 [Methylobacterium crusticola]|uniref:Uncharacterized protein n=1 Tax=Methylobacterium crusticola TaxID=1697972 RepID=A0ABQ4RAM9_9HYPH|nr:hypothetical protein OPKNFCMD_6605 [Methylobacterium crusticola]
MGAGRTDRGAGGSALVAAEIVQEEDVARREGRDEDVRDIAAQDGAVDRPIGTLGAVTRSWRSAATKVSVRQGPCATLAARRVPRGPQPRSGAMLVLDPGLVDEDAATRSDFGLIAPASVGACARHPPGPARPPAEFFLKLSPWARTNTQTARRSVFTPRSARSATRPRTVNGPRRTRSASHRPGSPDRTGFLCPPIRPGVSAPVCASSLRHFETQDGWMDGAWSIARIVSPASTRAKARPRRSSEQACVIPERPSPKGRKASRPQPARELRFHQKTACSCQWSPAIPCPMQVPRRGSTPLRRPGTQPSPWHGGRRCRSPAFAHWLTSTSGLTIHAR